MITPELSRRSQELAAAREPYVTATVVRVQHPTSVQPGSVALVLYLRRHGPVGLNRDSHDG